MTIGAAALRTGLDGYGAGGPNMLRSVLRPAVLAAAGACVLALAGCTSTSGGLGDGATSGATTPGGSASPSPTDTLAGGAGAACDLLTQADVSAAANRQVGEPVPRTVAGASVCQFDDVVVTRLRSPVTAAQFDQTVRQVASAVQGQIVPVSGIGQTAAYIPLLKEICVVREPTFFCVAGLDQPASQQLAKKAVARV